MADVYVLLYRSRARRGLTEAEVTDILEASARNNPAQGVTGLLVYSDLSAVTGLPGSFTQWLEGPQAAVEATFARIARDARHTHVEVLARGDARQLTGGDARLFPSWSMGLEPLDGLLQTAPAFVRYAAREAAAREARGR